MLNTSKFVFYAHDTHELTPKQEIFLGSQRDQFVWLMEKVNRNGIPNLLKWLNDSDFYTAPCSAKYHNCFPGGLCKHSLDTYELFNEKVDKYQLRIDEDTRIIAPLLHDLAKIGIYFLNKEGEYEKVEPAIPLGHGELSIFMAQQFIQLTVEEAVLIRWHMAAFEIGVMLDKITSTHYRAAQESHRAIIALHTADFEAANYL